MEVVALADSGDERGSSWRAIRKNLSSVGFAGEIHVMTIRPGRRRGDHLHTLREEILIVIHTSDWTLLWEDPAGVVRDRQFDGEGAHLLKVDRRLSHAIVNRGSRDLIVISVTTGEYDPASPETFRRPLGDLAVEAPKATRPYSSGA